MQRAAHPVTTEVLQDIGRLIFIHHQCWEVLPFCCFQCQWCIKIRVLRAQDFYTLLALKTAKGQHLPALVVYKNQSPRYDGTTSWLKYSDAVEEWCDPTKIEAKRRGPDIAARLSGRAELFKERLDRNRLKDPETGVEYLLSTLRPYFVKDDQSVFFYRFFQILRCNHGQTAFQRWMVRYELPRQKAIEAWLDITTPRPAVAAECDAVCRCTPGKDRGESGIHKW